MQIRCHFRSIFSIYTEVNETINTTYFLIFSQNVSDINRMVKDCDKVIIFTWLYCAMVKDSD